MNRLFLLFFVGWFANAGLSQDTNYDESKIPKYELPKLMVNAAGEKVDSVDDWRARRSEVLDLFEQNVYGKTPDQSLPTRIELIETGLALDGKAIRKQVRILFGKDESVHQDVLIYRPVRLTKPAPAFVGLNFYGNQTVSADPEIKINQGWMRGNSKIGVVNNRITEKSRGVYAHRWQVEKLIDRGYALVTAYCGDVDPDRYKNSFDDGIHVLFYKEGQKKPADDEWGSIGAWAWGLSRVMDYLQTDVSIDAAKVAVIGHSRLGKTALWAGAQDERFAIVISNNSGCGGAALFRRRFGETIGHMARTLPDWFCANHRQYANNEDNLPVDQHMLIALMAPRPVYVASATNDRWADPKGEFLAAQLASPAYALYGKPGLENVDMPAPNQSVQRTIGYHIREGKHDVTEFDWDQYLTFADKHLGR